MRGHTTDYLRVVPEQGPQGRIVVHNSVSMYQRRYADMPRPIVNLGQGRCRLWLRPEIERWVKQHRLRGR
jgi:hypothetical protein